MHDPTEPARRSSTTRNPLLFALLLAIACTTLWFARDKVFGERASPAATEDAAHVDATLPASTSTLTPSLPADAQVVEDVQAAAQAISQAATTIADDPVRRAAALERVRAAWEELRQREQEKQGDQASADRAAAP